MATIETRDEARNARLSTDLPARPSEAPGEMASRRPADRLAGMVAGGSSAEAVGGAAAIVLGILGLAEVYPLYMLPIGVIVLGVAILLEGGSLLTRYKKLLRSASPTTEFGGGMRLEMLGGIAGIVLGILSLLGIVPLVLCAVAAIVFGGTLLLTGSAHARLNELEGHYHGWDESTQAMAREATQTGSGLQVIVGVGAIVLGILALLGIATQILCLISLLAVGGMVLLSGAALSTKIFGSFRT